MKQLERDLQEAKRLQRVAARSADARKWMTAIWEDLLPLQERADQEIELLKS